MGALVVTFKRFGFDLRQLLVVVALNVYVTFQSPGISWQGHLGGLVVGAIVGAAMVYPPQRTRTVLAVGDRDRCAGGAGRPVDLPQRPDR